MTADGANDERKARSSMMDLFECIQNRRSIRRFKPQRVGREEIERLIDSARWAPSWNNCKAVRYIAVENPAERKLISERLVAPENVSIVGGAPLLLVLSIVKNRSGYERDGTTSTAKGSSWEMFDTGLACQNICLAAEALGLGTCIMASFDEDGVSRLVELPEDELIVALVACGYPDEVPKPPRRKEVGEILRYRA